MEAVSNDEKLAEQILAQDTGEEVKPTRRMSEFSADVELLSAIVDRIGELINVLAAVNGAKPGKVHYQPRPETALERVRARRRSENHRKLVARVLPHKKATP